MGANMTTRTYNFLPFSGVLPTEHKPPTYKSTKPVQAGKRMPAPAWKQHATVSRVKLEARLTDWSMVSFTVSLIYNKEKLMSKSGGGKSSSGSTGKGRSSGGSKAPAVPNLPSTTGNPSGGGRGNAAPKGK